MRHVHGVTLHFDPACEEGLDPLPDCHESARYLPFSNGVPLPATPKGIKMDYTCHGYTLANAMRNAVPDTSLGVEIIKPTVRRILAFLGAPKSTNYVAMLDEESDDDFVGERPAKRARHNA